jgi:hypothetical protein
MVKFKFNHTFCYDALHPTFTVSLPSITYPHYFTLTTPSIYNFIVKCLEIREHKGLAPELFSTPKQIVLCVQIYLSNSRQNYTPPPNTKVILLAEMQIWRNPIIDKTKKCLNSSNPIVQLTLHQKHLNELRHLNFAINVLFRVQRLVTCLLSVDWFTSYV